MCEFFAGFSSLVHRAALSRSHELWNRERFGESEIVSGAPEHTQDVVFGTARVRIVRCRRVSYRHGAAATETFRLSTRPSMGMRTKRSQRSRVSRRSPW